MQLFLCPLSATTCQQVSSLESSVAASVASSTPSAASPFTTITAASSPANTIAIPASSSSSSSSASSIASSTSPTSSSSTHHVTAGPSTSGSTNLLNPSILPLFPTGIPSAPGDQVHQAAGLTSSAGGLAAAEPISLINSSSKSQIGKNC
ncbi:unnamed protein product [Protopolystoma xenopodis]|uniref:Uncharacterized protein n=1 Tax=Protopolystoma xenopodis TaxID=117903 RepID=A0A448WQH1_9PLAT|nr:unnamed protein product [Protopolystoma xenopodis]